MFSRAEDKKIETSRLLLRKFVQDDLARFAEIMGDDQVGKQLPKGAGYTIKEVEKWLESIIEIWSSNDYGIWAVLLKDSRQFIGYCGLNKIDELGEIEVLYALDRKYWKNGYATEAVQAVLKYGFDILELKKVVGLARPDNFASIKVLEKNGLSYQDTMEIFGMTCRYYEINSKDFFLNW